MDFWPEFLASSWGREFVAGGFGGTAGVITGYPLDTLRVRLQQSRTGSALGILRRVVASEGPSALYRGMAAPFASVTLQTYALLSQALDKNIAADDPPSYTGVAFGGIGTGAIQSLLLSPVELIKIRLQLQQQTIKNAYRSSLPNGPINVAKSILQTGGWRGLYRGITITVLRDAPAHGVYFWTYEYMRERLHPGCRKNGQETFQTMLLAGGLAGVTSWICCYPLDVIKTRIQSESGCSEAGIVDCFKRIVKYEGYKVLWRGLGTAVTRAFIVNGTIFSAYEIALRCLFDGKNHATTSN
ncbi:mitochondrial arginine transporter BAC2-like isoform X2 [Henckelia pumila]|uniref:mitochondrial arginine transporter BAC2-like isoform X2 n=1 Tax=Henckelia pumila TaxID=405737 RepID=UPI003C6E4DDD